MAIATEAVTPQAPAAEPVGTTPASTPPAAQAPVSTPVVPALTAPPAPTETVDWKSRHDKLTTESIPKLQSDLSRTTTERDELKERLAKLPENIEDFEYEVAHTRDVEYLTFLEDVANKGFTLKQTIEHLRNTMRGAQGQRDEFETKRSTIDGLIKVVDGYDKGFATFLRDMDKNGARVAHESLPNLRGLYDKLTAGGNTPAQAATAATAATPAVTDTSKEPPVVAPAGGAPTMPNAPVWQPGMKSRDLIKKAVAAFSTDMSRKPRGG